MVGFGQFYVINLLHKITIIAVSCNILCFLSFKKLLKKCDKKNTPNSFHHPQVGQALFGKQTDLT